MAKAKRVAVSIGPRVDVVIDPALIRPLEALLMQAIQCTGNDQRMRDRIIEFSNKLKRRAMDLHGFITPDSEAITAILRATDTKQRDGRVFGEASIWEYLEGALTPAQAEAANNVRAIWDAFSTFLSVAARDYEPKSRSMKASAPQPLDVMPDETWEAYKEWFKPWLSAASRRRANCIRNQGSIIHADIVHRILVQEQPPGAIDLGLRLKPGTALAVLREEMNYLSRGGATIVESEVVETRVFIAPEAAESRPA